MRCPQFFLKRLEFDIGCKWAPKYSPSEEERDLIRNGVLLEIEVGGGFGGLFVYATADCDHITNNMIRNIDGVVESDSIHIRPKITTTSTYGINAFSASYPMLLPTINSTSCT